MGLAPPALAAACMLLLLAIQPAAAQAPAMQCRLAGAIASDATPLPGVALTLTTADGQPVDVSSTAPDGTFVLRVPASGGFVLTAELVAFETVRQRITIDPSRCDQKTTIAMTLASRATSVHPPTARAVPARSPAIHDAPAPVRAGGGQGSRAATGRAGQGAGGFQNLALLADQNGARDEGSPDETVQALLPPGFSPETSSDAVTSLGGTQAAATVGFGERPEFFAAGGPGGAPGVDGAGAAAPGTFGPRAGGPFGGLAGGPGGPGGGSGFGGPGGFGGRIRQNQIRGAVFQGFDSSALDAPPFSLNGHPTTNADYYQQRLGATVGGPLVVPKLVSSPKTFFFLNYTGNHASNPFDAYANVPTAAERAGDFSGVSRTIVDPATGQPFAGNQVSLARQNPAALALLDLIPLPNQDGTRQNFHQLTTTTTHMDDVNVRVVHNFGDAPRRGPGGFGGGFGGGRAAGAAGGNVSNLNVAVHYRHQHTDTANVFPSIGGSSRTSAWDVPVSYTFTAHGIVNTGRAEFNRQRSDATNLFAGATDVAGAAGILGVSTDPYDWGAPSLAFSSITGLADVTPSTRVNQTIALGDQMIKSRGRHTWRWGGDYRDVRMDSRADPNARGSFVFTGLYTGLDFADFLLGYPQQSAVQFGAGTERFRQRSGDLYLQDDWRARDTLTLNVGVRYEYVSPFTESQNRLVNLDAPADFSAAVPVVAGGTGPYFGAFPDSLVTADRNNVAPRVGVAWRPKTTIVVRAGYGISYSTSVYQSIAQQLANEPPFAYANTLVTTAGAPVDMTRALLQQPSDVTTNAYGVDPRFRTPQVQMWNVDVQREIGRTWNVGAGYVGTKGSNLDILRAPNRTPVGGLRIAGVDPFLWESSGATSIMNALTLRVRKRLTRGFAAGATYTLSKSIDDASSIGGGTTVVAQNDLDLEAERGPSSFDQRHRLNADLTFELPFGPNRRWLRDGGAMAALLGGWALNANAQFASGVPFTARVLSSAFDVSGGVNGSLRANYTGSEIQLAVPTTDRWFNTAAFSIPPYGTFGNAGRNTIVGPGISNVNVGATKNITLAQNRVLSLQVVSANVFNTPQYSAIDTVVNSPTFGQVTAARAPRRIQVVTRFRF